MIGWMQIFLSLWLVLQLAGAPAAAQTSDQALPNAVVAEVLTLLAPMAVDAPDLLWAEGGQDVLTLGIKISVLPPDSNGVGSLAKTLRDALWLRAVGPVSVQGVMGGVTLGVRVPIGGSAVASFWTVRAGSETLVVLLMLPEELLVGLSAEEPSNEPVAEELPHRHPGSRQPPLGLVLCQHDRAFRAHRVRRETATNIIFLSYR